MGQRIDPESPDTAPLTPALSPSSEESSGSAPLGSPHVLGPFAGSKISIRYEADIILEHGRGRLITTESVIGPDDRELIKTPSAWPYRATGQLLIWFPHGQCCLGTGSLIGERYVLTAAHNLYDPEYGGKASRVVFTPGRNLDEDPPFGWSTAVRCWFPPAYAQHDDTADYALVWLDRPLGREAGWYSVAVREDSALRTQEAIVAGYPIDKPERGRQMWGARNRIVWVDRSHVYYEVDTGFGQSGSGVFIEEAGRRRLIAVHTEGQGSRNCGVRITESVYADLFGQIREAP